MDRLTEILRAIIQPLGWITALLVLVTPTWFLVAALGTKLSFWDWPFGLDWMTLDIGPKLVLACAATGLVLAGLVIAHRVAARRWFGVMSVPILALLVAAGHPQDAFVCKAGVVRIKRRCELVALGLACNDVPELSQIVSG